MTIQFVPHVVRIGRQIEGRVKQIRAQIEGKVSRSLAAVEKLKGDNEDRNVGIAIATRAMTEPLRQGRAHRAVKAASIAFRIAIGPHAGRKALTLYSVPPLAEVPNNPLLAQSAGFSLHAATICEAHQRSRLERLCRYITRPPTR